MTDATVRSSEERPAYDLRHELDGTSTVVRENLGDILERELLGPVGGPDERLPVSPRAKYLVGYIAPVKLVGASSKANDDADEGDLAEVRLDEEGLNEGRGVPSFPVEEANGEAQDDDADDRAPTKGLMIPASMGLRFQIPLELDAFRVAVAWGTYEAVDTDRTTKAGRPIKEYQRTPVEEERTIRLADLDQGRTSTVPLRDSVVLRVDRYDDIEHGRCLIELALCNDRETPSPIPLYMWLFQTVITVDAGGADSFLPVRDVMEADWPEHDEEVRRLQLQYRDRLEFAIGRTCSVDWTAAKGARRATSVRTTWLPVGETPQTRAGSVEGALLEMAQLATASAQDLRVGLAPLVDGYQHWLQEREEEASRLPQHLRQVATEALLEAAQIRERLSAGLQHLLVDEEALRCFQFMNRVMHDQRIASQVAAERSSDASLSIAAAHALVADRGPSAAAWRPFQLAFILMQLPSMTDPSAKYRSSKHFSKVELLFFPTGGGKTEAYLGLAAFTFAIRRRQGVVQGDSGPLNGSSGIAVLMRYTLRLLTAQQFQRATVLICAAELVRREDETTWGTEPFRIGLWVGTDVSPKRFEEAEEQLVKANEFGGYRLTVLQIQRCPWCGTPISAAHVKADPATRRVLVHCGDDLARCPFAKGGSVEEGLPVLTVDEEIYRLAPSFVIATVDKFARLAREGEAAALFGYVAKRCARHGYVHADYAHCQVASHPAKDGLPAASVTPVGRLRPPDLIIQDELHLITGALGTAVGLFEVAVETLCSWRHPNGTPVKPLIVASTATVRNAQQQVRELYGRQVEIFPPQVLDVADTFFSYEIPIDSKNPGRRYIGVSAQGVRLSSAEIRVAEVLLLSGQLLLDRAGEAADPYMTLVAYFNATRELAGMSRYIVDDVSSRVFSPRPDSGFVRRRGTNFGALHLGELTSRIASSEIGETLDHLGRGFGEYDTTSATQQRIKAGPGSTQAHERPPMPFDVVLATSMLQVGVDVQRLGLMLVVGQPKNTAEYIQASSRVGRDPSDRPGLVVSLGNWARPRDLAHFEQFRRYHETFYSQVEALSVTPYSPTSLERGIDGLLVSVARVQQAAVPDGLSPEREAGRIEDQRTVVEAMVETLKERIAAAAQDDATLKRANDLLVNRVDKWAARSKEATQRHKTLVYERTGDGDRFLPLIVSPENVLPSAVGHSDAPFKIANSMREVQPEINLLVSPVPERLFAMVPDGVPSWSLPVDEED